MRTRTPPRLRTQSRRPRGRPKAEDLQALEARLVLVARHAFALHGYGATSINAIAKSARVSKNTLYARFPSKAALFQAIVAGQIASVDEELPRAAAEQDQSLGARLRAYMDVALRRSLSGEVLAINRLIMSESYQFPELAEAARARFAVGIQHVAAIVEECAKRDGIPCRNPVEAAELFLHSLYGWYTFVVIANRVVTDKERTSRIDGALRLFLASRAAW